MLFPRICIDCGTPCGMEHQKWVEIVDAMIEAFKLIDY